jgi:Na+/H+-dicarboxylate symporter
MSFTLRVLAGLILGLAIGIGISVARVPWLLPVPGLVEPLGILFVNLIRMTVIPLVVSSLIVGVASMRDARAVGRLGIRSLVLFLVALGAATVFAAATAYPLLGRLAIDPAVAARLRESAAGAGRTAAESAKQLPSLAQWVTDLVPVNVFKAAADGAILPLIVFALAFGIALTAIDRERRQAVVRVFHGIADSMLLLVGWILRFTPVGVFALAVPLGARMGVAAAGSLVYYIVLLSGVSAAFIIIVVVPAGVLLGRVPIGRFVRASAPATAVAFSSRSSLAALPATIEAARTALALPEEIASFFLPLAASMFRVGGAICQMVAVLFVARLYGVDLAVSQMATVIVTVVLTSFTIPGIPAGAIIVMAPVLASVGVPVEGIGILMGVDTIPDMFRTTANVVGWLAAGSILARTSRKVEETGELRAGVR